MNVVNLRALARPATMTEKMMTQLIDLLEKHIRDAYREGYLQGQADERRRT